MVASVSGRVTLYRTAQSNERSGPDGKVSLVKTAWVEKLATELDGTRSNYEVAEKMGGAG